MIHRFTIVLCPAAVDRALVSSRKTAGSLCSEFPNTVTLSAFERFTLPPTSILPLEILRNQSDLNEMRRKIKAEFEIYIRVDQFLCRVLVRR